MHLPARLAGKAFDGREASMPSCMQISLYSYSSSRGDEPQVHLSAISFNLLLILHSGQLKNGWCEELEASNLISSTNPVERTKKPWVTTANSDRDESTELVKALKKAARVDRIVILTILEEPWVPPNSVIDLFLESFRIGHGTSDLLRHLVIIAMDQRAFDTCRAVHTHCLFMVTQGLDFSARGRWKTRWQRIEVLFSVLELGYHFILTDADVMWLRNPLPHFTSGADIIFSGDTSDWSNRENGGFYYVRSTDMTVEFYKYWYMQGALYPGLDEQHVFNIIHPVVHEIGLRIQFLDPAYFGGFCQQTSADLNRIRTMHASCCVGVESKLNDLRLVLEDWRNFTALSTQEKTIKGVAWRAPSMCKQWK
ncbi:hypothetical protein ACLOJK_025444 [Asimina triloba]